MKYDKLIFVFILGMGFFGTRALAQNVPEEKRQFSVVDEDVADKFGQPEEEDVTEERETVLADENVVETPPDDELIYLNATDVDIKDMIKQISKATGTNFIIDEKLRGKITIISEKPMTKEMAYQAFLSALEVMGYTTVQTPAGLIKIVQTKDSISEPLDFFKEDSPNTDRFITRILQVKNISANELATVIKGLVSKEGNLFAYPSTNSLIVTDSGSNIDRVLKIIKELDQEGPQEVIEIIPIEYADSADIAEKILQLFEEESASKSSGRSRSRSKTSSAELEDTPSISKVIADERTNSIIILGSKRAIIKVRALIARLDSPLTGVEGTIHVYYLKHANAQELAEVLSNLVSGNSSKSTSSKTKKGDEKEAGAVNLEGGVKVTADEGTNSLVITASPKDFQTLVDSVIAKLDIPRRQVYLEAVVMELDVDKQQSVGFAGNLGSIFSMAGENITGFGAVLPTAPQTLTSIAGAAGGLAGGIFSERTIDFTLSDGSTVSIPAISAILQALQTNTDVNILSTPSILTLDNEEAQIQVGQEVPTPSGTTVSSGVTSFDVTREDTGIILKVTPQISESDTVRLQISQEITNVISTDENLGPTLTKRAVDTVVVAHDKQTIVIGGLIDDQNSVTTNKIPLLGDIPLLGMLFRNRSTHKVKTNIIVFITPYIIQDRSDYLEILQKKIEERNLFIDLNYGKSQRKQIRESIKNHAENLLEFKADTYKNLNSPSTVIESSSTSGQTKSYDVGTTTSESASTTSSAETDESQTTQKTETVSNETAKSDNAVIQSAEFASPSRRVKVKSRAR